MLDAATPSEPHADPRAATEPTDLRVATRVTP